MLPPPFPCYQCLPKKLHSTHGNTYLDDWGLQDCCGDPAVLAQYSVLGSRYLVHTWMTGVACTLPGTSSSLGRRPLLGTQYSVLGSHYSLHTWMIAVACTPPGCYETSSRLGRRPHRGTRRGCCVVGGGVVGCPRNRTLRCRLQNVAGCGT